MHASLSLVAAASSSLTIKCGSSKHLGCCESGKLGNFGERGPGLPGCCSCSGSGTGLGCFCECEGLPGCGAGMGLLGCESGVGLGCESGKGLPGGVGLGCCCDGPGCGAGLEGGGVGL